MEICAGWLDREYENYAYNGITYRCLEPSTNVIMFSRKKNVRLFDEFIKIRLIKNKIYGITAKPGHFDKKKPQVLFMFVRLFKIDGGRIVITVLLKNLGVWKQWIDCFPQENLIWKHGTTLIEHIPIRHFSSY